MTNPQHEALVEAVARAVFEANNPGDDWTAEEVQLPVDWFKSLADHYRFSARAAIAALSATAATPSDEVVRLRAALVESAIPLEAMILAGRPLGVSPDLWSGIIKGVQQARSALEPQAKDV